MPGDQRNNANELPRWFSDMWVPELSPPPIVIRMFGQETAILPQNMLSWAHIGLAGSFGDLLVGWWMGVARGAVSRNTFIYFIL